MNRKGAIVLIHVQRISLHSHHKPGVRQFFWFMNFIQDHTNTMQWTFRWWIRNDSHNIFFFVYSSCLCQADCYLYNVSLQNAGFGISLRCSFGTKWFESLLFPNCIWNGLFPKILPSLELPDHPDLLQPFGVNNFLE